MQSTIIKQKELLNQLSTIKFKTLGPKILLEKQQNKQHNFFKYFFLNYTVSVNITVKQLK